MPTPNWKHTVHILAKAQYNIPRRVVDAILKKHSVIVTQENVVLTMALLRRYRDPETDKRR